VYELAGRTIWVAGHRGLVGSALLRRLAREDCEVLTATREALDLTRQAEVEDFVAATRPDAIILAAARVGGILANQTFPADFLHENLMIGANIVAAAHRTGVERLLYLGSSCVYPRLAPQPITEEALLTGPLEPTNQAYAIAKIAGLKLVEAYRRQYGRDYIAAMPTNLYGPGDDFDLANAHVLAALVHKAHAAKISRASHITVWGSGTPRREFLHVDDCADALVLLLQRYCGNAPINVGTGRDIAILDLARLVCRVVGYTGEIILDRTKPDGTPRKLLNIENLAALGWTPLIDLEDGIAATYRWFCENRAETVPA